MTDMTSHLTSATRSQWREVWDQFKSHRRALVGMVIFAIILVLSFIGPLV